MLLMVAIFVAVSVPAYVAFDWIINRTIVKLGTLFAEKQVLFDRYRGLETLMREASLAQTLARSPALRAWAEEEERPESRERGLSELEHYREAFKGGSYFFVIDRSGNYYFNDRDNSYAGQQFRYRIDKDNPRDGWYFATRSGPDGCQLNVDHDDNLRVTNVWINCKVTAEGRTLGVVGTGIDLTSFIREVVDVDQRGVESIFVDRNGAIQAHRDPKLIDFHSLTKDTKSKNTIFKLLDDPVDRAAVAATMERVAAGGTAVEARFVRIGGQQVLAGIGYLDRIGWFNVTLMDVDRIIDRGVFRPIAALLAAILALATVLAAMLFKRSVLDRLALLEGWVARMRAGDFSVAAPPVPDRPADEIDRLFRDFGEMAGTVREHTQHLESVVRERTEKLERLAHIDLLTDIYNRRGFLHAVEVERNRARRSGAGLGLIMIDLDLFKQINDRYGHRAGDAVLVEVARRMGGSLRAYDVIGRWGGDEFIMLVEAGDPEMLRRIAEKVRQAVGGTPIRLEDRAELPVTISVGACLLHADMSIEAITAEADNALYEAKKSGRNRVALRGPTLAAG